ncbi:MAG: peptidase M14, partial [Bacteroidales bacterium]|nr:peptidase M14 [Bacteroidales bacterium]
DAHRNAAFCLYNAYETPKLEISNLKVNKIEGGLREITASITNTRMIPTHSASNLKFKIDPPVYVSLDGGTVIAGMTVENADLNITSEQKRNPQRIEIPNIAGYQKVDVKWIVKGGNKYTVSVESVKGGRTSAQTK